MKETNYWENFLKTGNIKDYLTYRQEESRREDIQRYSYAGVSHSNRDDITCRANRGI